MEAGDQDGINQALSHNSILFGRNSAQSPRNRHLRSSSTMISSSPPLTPNNGDTFIPKVLRAFIHDVGQRADCMGSYTAFIIHIYCDGDSYQLERRYREFYALNTKINAVSPDCSDYYKFPPKELITFRNRRNTIRFRVAALNECLNMWTNDSKVLNSKLIHEFLEIPLEGISPRKKSFLRSRRVSSYYPYRKSSTTSSRSEIPNPLAKTPLLSAPQIVDAKGSHESQTGCSISPYSTMAVCSNTSETSGSDMLIGASEQITRRVEGPNVSERASFTPLNKVHHQENSRPIKSTSSFLSPPTRDLHSLSRNLNQNTLKIVLEE